MTISDKIQLASVIVSLVIAVGSAILSCINIQLSRKALEESVRADIQIYVDATYFEKTSRYLILRNFGHTTAVIEEFATEPEVDWKKCSVLPEVTVPFSHIKGMSIGPGQAFQIPIIYNKFKEVAPIVTFTIVYKSGKKTYREQIPIKVEAQEDFPKKAQSCDSLDKSLETLAKTIQNAFVRRL